MVGHQRAEEVDRLGEGPFLFGAGNLNHGPQVGTLDPLEDEILLMELTVHRGESRVLLHKHVGLKEGGEVLVEGEALVTTGVLHSSILRRASSVVIDISAGPS